MRHSSPAGKSADVSPEQPLPEKPAADKYKTNKPVLGSQLTIQANFCPSYAYWSWMPKFYLHVLERDKRTEDLEGADYADLSSAREEAIASAIDVVCDSLRARKGLRLGRSIVIADDDGRTVEEISFEVAVQPPSKNELG